MLTIGFLVYDDMQALDLAGPLDVFGAANGRTAGQLPPPYASTTIGLDTRPVRTENGLAIVPEHAIGDAPPLDTLLIPGGIGSRLTLSRDPALLAWVRARAQTTRRVVSVCTGIYVLAAAGLLGGRRATTHWRFAAELAALHPEIRMDADQLHIRDGMFHTSGGLTAGMDLALSLVEEDLGAEAALAVARDLVMYVKRPGNQAQFSAPLHAQSRASGRMGQLVDWLLEHLDEDLSVERLAEQATMSPRNFRRVFKETFGAAPARYVEQLRLERACVLLTAGSESVDRIAMAVGFDSADTFRRVFRARFGASPREYRQRFSH